MKQLLLSGLFLLFLLLAGSGPAAAQDFVYEPKNPAFGAATPSIIPGC
ncbi:curli assembly protein CsgF [Hymenobacter cellulosilyticus]|uniref:Curli assembly protein CsgF n=1 Tax=Hymenobacter cellulosilyticus TaxID=2932248 RepID=A0A8T9Q822_9BACT|nr:curli assembly protein CsgF [Hymenobacter cellulosilyticus]UOQ71669.1 curli assembly protein CsgF [Hymenobacter cellulosilyticus]